MISPNDILLVGRTHKPHGIRGEITLVFRTAEYADVDTEFYFLQIDGIPVPFFVEEFTYGTDVAARVKFDGVNDEKAAARYANLDVFLPREMLKTAQANERFGWHAFVGYSVVDESGDTLGIIEDVDDATLNVLFIVRNGDNELLIPATEDFIAAIDEENRLLEMHLPEGLFE